MDRKDQIIGVVWVDPYSIDEWTDIDELDIEEHICKSVGIVVAESSQSIALSAAVGYDQESGIYDAACTMIIPRRCILSIIFIAESFHDLLPDPDKGA